MAERFQTAAQVVQESRRLFFALWPPSDARAAIASRASEHIAAASARAVPARNFHVTLAFLGDVADARMAALTDCARRSHGAPGFALQFDQVEAWLQPRVLCLVGASTPPKLQQLFERLRANLFTAGFDLRQDAYRPHVTIARAVSAEYRAGIEPIGWAAHDFVLAQSRRDQTGSNYTIIERWPLG